MQDLLAQMLELSKGTSKDALQRELSIDQVAHQGVKAVTSRKHGKRTAMQRFMSRASSRDMREPLSRYSNPVVAAETNIFDDVETGSDKRTY